jgi:tagatose 6-phosphate kinase
MRDHILTVTLNPAIDKIARVRGFRVGRELRAERVRVTAGGKGVNVSRVLKTLGARSVATGFVGGSSGAYLQQQLEKERIKSCFAWASEETRTNLTVIDPSTKHVTRILERGPLVRQDELARFEKTFASLLRNCGYVIFSGSLCPGLPEALYRELIEIANSRGVRAALDTSGAPLEAGLKAKPFLIKPNIREAEEILRRELNSLRRVKEAAEYFKSLGVEIVCITMGSRGAVAAHDGDTVMVVPPRVKREITVGCGDSFIGGFVFAHRRGLNFIKCLRTAAAAGAANAMAIAPGGISRAAVKRLASRVAVKRL